MLYDPKWEAPAVKADHTTLTLADFIAWLETQNPNQSYNWLSPCNCVVGQFLTATTGNRNPGGMCHYDKLFGGLLPYYEIAGTAPYTFGAALERAKAAQQ